MSDKEKIGFEEFVDYLIELGSQGPHSCPFCKSTKWTLTAADGQEVDGDKELVSPMLPLGTVKMAPSALTEGGLSVLAMSCKECGYMNLFNYQIVQDRIQRLRAKDSEVTDPGVGLK